MAATAESKKTVKTEAPRTNLVRTIVRTVVPRPVPGDANYISADELSAYLSSWLSTGYLLKMAQHIGIDETTGGHRMFFLLVDENYVA